MDNKVYRLVVGVFAVLVIALLSFVLLRPKQPHVVEKPPAPPIEKKLARGTIAIVIDDVGYSAQTMNIYSQIHLPLTVSVLPNLPFTSQAAQTLHDRHFEVILHLPMEPKNASGLEDRTILVSMTADPIRSIVAEDLASVKYAKGVSNHMGSKATEDTATLKPVFEELKKRRLFFLDSFTSTRSIAEQTAREYGLRSARRDIFLDNRSEREYIRRQLALLKQKAQKNGRAVGIGHDRKTTLEVLREEMPAMAKEGYRFVFISDLVE